MQAYCRIEIIKAGQEVVVFFHNNCQEFEKFCHLDRKSKFQKFSQTENPGEIMVQVD